MVNVHWIWEHNIFYKILSRLAYIQTRISGPYGPFNILAPAGGLLASLTRGLASLSLSSSHQNYLFNICSHVILVVWTTTKMQLFPYVTLRYICKKNEMSDVARLHLMAPMDFWQNFASFFGVAVFCTTEIDDFRGWPQKQKWTYYILHHGIFEIQIYLFNKRKVACPVKQPQLKAAPLLYSFEPLS